MLERSGTSSMHSNFNTIAALQHAGSGDASSPGGLWGWYLAALASSPLLTKSATSAVMNLLGDLLAQVGAGLCWLTPCLLACVTAG